MKIASVTLYHQATSSVPAEIDKQFALQVRQAFPVTIEANWSAFDGQSLPNSIIASCLDSLIHGHNFQPGPGYVQALDPGTGWQIVGQTHEIMRGLWPTIGASQWTLTVQSGATTYQALVFARYRIATAQALP